jgi:cytochrome c nitrite reductase small subunit
MKKLHLIINWLLPSYRMKVSAIIVFGILSGMGVLFLYTLRAHTYLANDPSACMNCHVMGPYYDSWHHSSHSRDATCNDCHVPHKTIAGYWLFKATDGAHHVYKFVTHQERNAIIASDGTREVIMGNCIRCHKQLVTEAIKDGRSDYMMTKVGEGKACWDCHRMTPHGQCRSLSSTPVGNLPYPDSPVPNWLRKIMKRNIEQ